ncbi:hypothetical protein [Aeromicrobium sp.]|uniref:[protein-PII] uridylyltransferase family protein n=1 Tax=Aeromicrobium sp. TaxID=1871063 RepID=UPI0025C52C25|nr:hypothetical protein [Aeromicrobium sp.]
MRPIQQRLVALACSLAVLTRCANDEGGAATVPDDTDSRDLSAPTPSTVANEPCRLLVLRGADSPLKVDANLRPEGKQGPLVCTLESYAAYYAKCSRMWEPQALLRADAVVGDADLRRRFGELIDPLWFPVDRMSEDDVCEVRRIKARVDQERLARGADPQTHLKLGSGGLAGIEWTAQLLQMRSAGQLPGRRRTTRTWEARAAARDAELLDPDGADVLAHGWRTVSRIRSAETLVRGKGGDELTRGTRELPRGGVGRDGQRLPADHPTVARGPRSSLLGLS